MERFVRGHYRLRDAPARSHPAQRRTASADGGRDVWPAAAFSLNSGLVSRAPFGLRGGTLMALSALAAHRLGWMRSRLLNSRAGRQAARKQLELAGTRSVPRGRLGLKGSWRLRTCQQVIKTLRATAALAGFALPVRALTSE